MKFDISKLKGKLGQLRDWMSSKNLPPRLVFIIMGVVSTVWFLIRVIPKPTRATYPCMQVAAPFMSGLVVYLIAVGGLTALSRRLKRKIINVRFGATMMLLTAVIVAVAIIPSPVSQTQEEEVLWGAAIEGPNKPFGDPKGIFPGRVVWVWNPDATNEKFERNSLDNYEFFWQLDKSNPAVISKMFQDGILKLTGEDNIAKSWDAIFKHFNQKKHNEARKSSKAQRAKAGMSEETKDILREIVLRDSPLIPISDFIEIKPENERVIEKIITDLRNHNLKIVIPMYNARQNLYAKRSKNYLMSDTEYLIVDPEHAISSESIYNYIDSITGFKLKEDTLTGSALFSIEKYLLSIYRQNKAKQKRKKP